MACGCASRMRRYILPWAGFQKEGDFWINERFPNVDLRVIKDSDVEQHHAALTTHLIFEMGFHEFKKRLDNANGIIFPKNPTGVA